MDRHLRRHDVAAADERDEGRRKIPSDGRIVSSAVRTRHGTRFDGPRRQSATWSSPAEPRLRHGPQQEKRPQERRAREQIGRRRERTRANGSTGRRFLGGRQYLLRRICDRTDRRSSNKLLANRRRSRFAGTPRDARSIRRAASAMPWMLQPPGRGRCEAS